MAGLAPQSAGIPASRQFAAIAYLRWRLFANGFRRKGGAGELAARIIVFPIAALFVIGPILGASFLAYHFTQSGDLHYFTPILWGIFFVRIVTSINISPPSLSFDPESLIRYPLTFTRYLTIRLFLGLLSVSTIIGTGALLGAATGITIADPALGRIAFATAIALALCDMLFVRMLFAWVDRWLSTRRARELFTGFIFLASIGFQYVNMTINGVGRHNRAERMAKYNAVRNLYHHIEPFLRDLPAGLGSSALQHGGNTALAFIAGILLFALLFLGVFAWRMHLEYRGENLSEASAQTHAKPEPKSVSQPRPTSPRLSIPSPAPSNIPPAVAASFEKEWITVRRNPAQLYALLMPLAMIFIVRGTMASVTRSGMTFPAIAAYAILAISPLAYNVLGMDASGVQFYFLAPIAFRSVILGKNLFSFAVTTVQIFSIYIAVIYIAGLPPILITISTLCWAVFACLVNATVGNMRSITAPRKMDPSKISRKQQSQLSALMAVFIVMAVSGIGVGLIGFARFAGVDWLPIPILLALAFGAFALYIAGLNRLDAMALNHRESLIEELCKAS